MNVQGGGGGGVVYNMIWRDQGDNISPRIQCLAWSVEISQTYGKPTISS